MKKRKTFAAGKYFPTAGLILIMITLGAFCMETVSARAAGVTENAKEFLESEETQSVWEQQKDLMREALVTMREMGVSPGGVLETFKDLYEKENEQSLEEAAGEAARTAQEQVQEKAEDISQQAVEKAEEKVEETTENVVNGFFERIERAISSFFGGKEG